MSDFTVYNVDNAPKESKHLLEESLKGFGMIPNLHGVMAEAPALLEAYKVLHKLFMETSFNAEEFTVIWQTINVENECHYCVPAHTAIANMMNVDPELTEALRNKAAMTSKKLQVLHDTTLAMVQNRGLLSDTQINDFFAAGYNKQQLLEIVVGLSQKIMSNYVNHIAKTPLDEGFKAFAWSPIR